MSSQFAIGAVSAVLRNLLDDGLIETAAHLAGPVLVTAVAPDSIKVEDPMFGPQLNLFLYRVSSNPGWLNDSFPAYDSDGTRISNPPLALNLHLLLTAYGKADFQAEILLGYAMSILHEHPVLDRASIRRALDPSPLGSILPPAFDALAASDLADQLEAVTVSLEPIDTEEMSRLWSAIQAHYRPTVGYLVSVVLIQSTKPVTKALPVLSRGGIDLTTGREAGVFVHADMLPPLPTLFSVTPQGTQTAARLGEKVVLDGVHLDGTSAQVLFDHPLLTTPNVVAIGVQADPVRIEVTLPSGAGADHDWPAGIWAVSVELVPTGQTASRSTNVAGMVLAPDPVLVPPTTVVRDAVTGHVTVTLQLHPQVRPSQSVTLALGSAVVTAEPHPVAAGTLTFKFGDIPDGPQWVRLSVGGVESLFLDQNTQPPSYLSTQKVAVPV